MPNPMLDEAIKSRADKLSELTGSRGEHPTEKATRIATNIDRPSDESEARGVPHVAEEHFIGAPARQVSDMGKVRK